MVNDNLFSLNIFHGEGLYRGLSNHSPILLKQSEVIKPKSPFRYFNYWAKCESFFLVVREAWDCDVEGTPFFRVATKLRRVKGTLKEWRKNQLSLDGLVANAKLHLEDIQKQLSIDPSNHTLSSTEKEASAILDKPLSYEESMYKQQS